MKNSKTLRIVQTGDWHLDVSPSTAPRHEDHAFFINWLLNHLTEQKINVLIHTGYIFDRHNASSKSLRMIGTFLSQASQIPSLKKIIIISGNNDSNRFLEALYPLLHLSTDISFHLVAQSNNRDGWQEDFIFPYRDDKGDILAIFTALPYTPRVKVTHERNSKQRNNILQTQIFDHYHSLYLYSKEKMLPKNAKVPFVAIGHLSCSEMSTKNRKDLEDITPRTIYSGEILPPSIFPKEYDHVALGHLYDCRSMDQERIWYSGTPVTICKQDRQTRHIIQVEFSLSKKTFSKNAQPIPVPEFRKTRFYAGPADIIFKNLQKDFKEDQERRVEKKEHTSLNPTSPPDQYLYIELQDNISNADFIKKMTDLYPNVRIVRLIRKKEEIEFQENETYITDLSALNVFTEIYRHETGKDPAEDVLELFLEIKDS